MIKAYYLWVWNTRDVYSKHWDYMLGGTLLLVIVTIVFMAAYHGFKGRSFVDGADGEEYFVIPCMEAFSIYLSPLVFQLLMALLPLTLIGLVGFIPFLIGKGLRKYIDWVNKPAPSPFVGQTMTPEDFEVKNDLN